MKIKTKSVFFILILLQCLLLVKQSNSKNKTWPIYWNQTLPLTRTINENYSVKNKKNFTWTRKNIASIYLDPNKSKNKRTTLDPIFVHLNILQTISLLIIAILCGITIFFICCIYGKIMSKIYNGAFYTLNKEKQSNKNNHQESERSSYIRLIMYQAKLLSERNMSIKFFNKNKSSPMNTTTTKSKYLQQKTLPKIIIKYSPQNSLSSSPSLKSLPINVLPVVQIYPKNMIQIPKSIPKYTKNLHLKKSPKNAKKSSPKGPIWSTNFKQIKKYTFPKTKEYIQLQFKKILQSKQTIQKSIPEMDNKFSNTESDKRNPIESLHYQSYF